MSTETLGRLPHVPISLHVETDAPVTVLHPLNSALTYRRPDELPLAKKGIFAADAWRKGLWGGDISIDGAKPMMMEDAIADSLQHLHHTL